MKRLMLMFACLAILPLHSADSVRTEDAAARIGLMLRQMEELKKDPKLTNEARESLERAEQFLRERQDASPVRSSGNLDSTRAYGDFKASPAYGFLNRHERRELDEMVRGKRSDLPRAAHGGSYSVPSDLRRGDLVFRREDSFLSRHFVEASRTEKRFSHVGIVVGVGSSPRVVTVGESCDGSAAAVPWNAFFAHASDAAVYRYKGEGVGERIASAAEKRIGVPFDPAFDLRTKNRLYCSELVRDAVNEAVGKSVIGTTKKGAFEYVAIDDCYKSGWTKTFDARNLGLKGDSK